MGSGPLQDALDQLIQHGAERRIAVPLIKRVAFEIGDAGARDPERVMDQTAAELLQLVEVADLIPPKSDQGPAIVTLVGPTGVGKTTTLAKLASQAKIKLGLKVGLINLDSYKLGAYDQLGAYAKILQVPFRNVATAGDLKAAIEELGNLDLILVDTAGRSQKDPQALTAMAEQLQVSPNVRTALVLSATTRDSELIEATKKFSVFKPVGILFSKLDEASVFGCLLNVPQRSKLPLLYFTTGQRVPEDIEPATAERVASLVLEL